MTCIYIELYIFLAIVMNKNKRRYSCYKYKTF